MITFIFEAKKRNSAFLFQKVVLVVHGIAILPFSPSVSCCSHFLCSTFLFFLCTCFVVYRLLQDSDQFLGKKEVPPLNPISANTFSVLFSGVLMLSFFIFCQKDTIQNWKVTPNTGFFSLFLIGKPKIDNFLGFVASPSFYNSALEVSLALA